MPKHKYPPMNKFQIAVCKTHGGGDYAHLVDEPNWRDALDDCGDTLFAFLMIELADEGEHPMDAETAEQRMESAEREVSEALAHVRQAALEAA